jgi:nicotinamidase-related amidase
MTSPDFTDTELEALARRQYQEGDAAFTLAAARTALLMIDMQEEYVTAAGGPYRVPEAGRRVPAMARLLEGCRQRRLPVVHTAFGCTHHFLDRPAYGHTMPNRAHGLGFDDSRLFQQPVFVPGLQPLADENVIHKPSYGAFYDTPLETILKRLGIEMVVLAGTLTDCCVGTTARQAYERGFGVVVASDATAAALPDMHEAELQILRRSFARVRTVREILEELG